MTEKSVVDLLKAGEFVALGEYRNSKAEMLRWRDKQTGRAMEAPILRHTVEFGPVSAAVNERVPDNTKIEDIKIPFHKGERVVCRLTELQIERGQVAVRGTLEKISLDGAGQPRNAPGTTV